MASNTSYRYTCTLYMCSVYTHAALSASPVSSPCQVLGDHTMQYEYRTMAAFALSTVVNKCTAGQVGLLLQPHSKQTTSMLVCSSITLPLSLPPLSLFLPPFPSPPPRRSVVYRVGWSLCVWSSWRSRTLSSDNGWPSVSGDSGRTMTLPGGTELATTLTKNSLTFSGTRYQM